MTHTQKINYLQKYVRNLKNFISSDTLTIEDVGILQNEITTVQKEIYLTEKEKLNATSN